MKTNRNEEQASVALRAKQNPTGFISFLVTGVDFFEEPARGIIRFLAAQPNQPAALASMTEKQAYTLYLAVSQSQLFTDKCEDCEEPFAWEDMPTDQPCGYCASVMEGIEKA